LPCLLLHLPVTSTILTNRPSISRRGSAPLLPLRSFPFFGSSHIFTPLRITSASLLKTKHEFLYNANTLLYYNGLFVLASPVIRQGPVPSTVFRWPFKEDLSFLLSAAAVKKKCRRRLQQRHKQI
jgi:hypothetical protein